MTPEIDVIIPFHRSDDYLRRAVNSARKSLQIKVNLILIDDRVTKTEPIEYLDPSDQIFTTTGGIGYAKSLALGLTKVRAEFTGFLDSDDLTHPKRFLEQIDYLNQNKLQIVSCDLSKFGGTKLQNLEKRVNLAGRVGGILPLLLGSYGANSSWVSKSHLLDDKWNECIYYNSIDWAVALETFNSFRIGHLKKPLYGYRQHKNQMTRHSAYRHESFMQLYPLWLRANERLKLPHLTPKEAQFLADPWGRALWNSNINEWFREALNFARSKYPTDVRILKAALGARIISNKQVLKSIENSSILVDFTIESTKSILQGTYPSKYFKRVNESDM